MLHLHDTFCRLAKVTGTMERADPAYWQRWVAPEVFRRGATGIKALVGQTDDRIQACTSAISTPGRPPRINFPVSCAPDMVAAFSTNDKGQYELKVQEYCGASRESFFELVSEFLRTTPAHSADRVSITISACLRHLLGTYMLCSGIWCGGFNSSSFCC
jgi:hypothetical protein